MVDRTKADRIRRIAGVTSGGVVTEVQVAADGSLVTSSAPATAPSFVSLGIAEIGVELTRPSDTNAYTANDVVSNSTSSPTVLTFSNVSRANGTGGYITKARLLVNSATAMLGAQIRLHLYHAAPAAINDNAAFTLLYANAASRVGWIDFPALTTEGSGSDSSYALWVDMPLKFHTASDSRNLYGIAEIKTVGAAPASGQKLYFFLGVEQF